MKGKRAADLVAAELAAGSYLPLRGHCVKCGREDIYLIWRHTPRSRAMIAACLDRNACAKAAWTRRELARRAAVPTETDGVPDE